MIEGILSGGILSGGCGPKTGGVLGVLVGVKMQCKRQFARSGQRLELGLDIFAAPNAPLHSAAPSVLPAATGTKSGTGSWGRSIPEAEAVCIYCLHTLTAETIATDDDVAYILTTGWTL